MKVGLASVRLWDGEAERNLAAMEKAAREAKAEGAVLCCFGESALQGFNCLCWDFETDWSTCVSVDSPLFRRICAMSREIAASNPDIRLETFPGAGHGLSFLADKERYARLAEEFIRGVTEG